MSASGDASRTSRVEESMARGLHAQEAARTIGFARVMMAVTGMAFALSLGMSTGHPLLRLAFMGSLAALFVVSGWVGRGARSPETYTLRMFEVFGVTAVITAIVAGLYLGIYSPVPLVVTTGIAYFGQGRSSRWALGICSAVVVGYTGIGFLIAADLMTDPGAISADALPLTWKSFFLVMVPVVMFGTLWQARIAVGAVRDTIRSAVEAQLDLEDARDAAEAAARAKTRFLANVSHEIRTPMNGIIGMTELLYRAEVDHRRRDRLRIVRDSSDALLGILDDLLVSARLEEGKVPVSEVDYDVRDLIDGVLATQGWGAATKGVELVGTVTDDVPARLRGDAARLRQVLLNLVSNAVKFTDDGEICIEVSVVDDGTVEFAVDDTGAGMSPDDAARAFDPFTQADQSPTRRHGGTGLGLAIVRQLVEQMEGEVGVTSELGRGSRFWARLPSTPAASGADPAATSGMLPASLVDVVVLARSDRVRRSLVELAGAQGATVHPCAHPDVGRAKLDSLSRPVVVVDHDSVPGGGLSWLESLDPRPPTVLLVPLVDPDIVARASDLGIEACVDKPVRKRGLVDGLSRALRVSPDAPRTPLPMPRLGDRVRALVVDDNRLNRMVAGAVLEQLGIRVTMADGGMEALEAIEDERFDVIFMDVQMPELDGIETTHEIRRREQRGGFRAKIVGLTAAALPEDRARSLEAGMDDYLPKPLRVRDLQDTLARLGVDPAQDVGGASGPTTALPES